MAIRDIVVYPDHRLRAPTVEVTSFDENLFALVEDMRDTMYSHQAVGIAANQIGRSERVLLIDPLRACDERMGEFPDPLVLVNPVIETQSKDLVLVEEGCLSFPGLYIMIKRPSSIVIKARVNPGWEEKEIQADGFFARALQHEYDHLTGRLLVDLVNFLQKKRINKSFKK